MTLTCKDSDEICMRKFWWTVYVDGLIKRFDDFFLAEPEFLLSRPPGPAHSPPQAAEPVDPETQVIIGLCSAHTYVLIVIGNVSQNQVTFAFDIDHISRDHMFASCPTILDIMQEFLMKRHLAPKLQRNEHKETWKSRHFAALHHNWTQNVCLSLSPENQSFSSRST